MKAPEYVVNSCEPGVLSGAELAACLAIIKAGGAVAVDLEKLRGATVLTVVRSDGQIVGVGAVKRVRTVYAGGIARKSGYIFPAKTPELGYVAVAPQHRRKGLSHRLVAALVAVQRGGLFATTYDKGMMKTLTAAGFAQKGHEWLGRKHQVSLWIRGAQAKPKVKA
jgi:GNAT superfamily N-acetyltransferase